MKKLGHTVIFDHTPVITSSAAVCGSKEREGLAGRYVDVALIDDSYGETTFEKAECKMLSKAISLAIKKNHLSEKDIDVMFAGDLLNQIISSGFAARDFDFPFLGVYSACSTMSESMLLSALLVDANFAKRVISATGSHFASAERQYRYPLEQGVTRPPQAQWTVTGAGACLISDKTLVDPTQNNVCIVSGTMGKVCDYGVTDANNMGAAMAVAAADTILRHFKDTGTTPDDFDLIVTGDLGTLGSKLLCDLTWEKGFDISHNHVDCGCLVYRTKEDEFQGGSGAGCSAVMFNSYILQKMKTQGYRRVLFAATGALLSTVSSGQGESIPCISHAVRLEVK